MFINSYVYYVMYVCFNSIVLKQLFGDFKLNELIMWVNYFNITN